MQTWAVCLGQIWSDIKYIIQGTFNKEGLIAIVNLHVNRVRLRERGKYRTKFLKKGDACWGTSITARTDRELTNCSLLEEIEIHQLLISVKSLRIQKVVTKEVPSFSFSLSLHLSFSFSWARLVYDLELESMACGDHSDLCPRNLCWCVGSFEMLRDSDIKKYGVIPGFFLILCGLYLLQCKFWFRIDVVRVHMHSFSS